MARIQITDLPVIDDLSNEELLGIFGGLQRPRPKPSIRYTVSAVNTATGLVRRITAKKNLLTLKNLPPGNYTASYGNYHIHQGPRVISRR